MCDLVIGPISPVYNRFEWMDFLHGHVDGSAAIIIPKPQPTKYNIRAITKPFQLWVWIGLLLTLLLTLFAFYALKRFMMKYRLETATIKWSHSKIFYYTIRLILNQGF
jgi:hypothetical protein